MGTLTVIFTVRIYNIPVAVMLSLVTTCIMLGTKLNKAHFAKVTGTPSHLCCAAAVGQSAGMPMPRAVGGTRWATGRESSTTTR
jgi:hypothetical protein